jgi:hypothetical protein
MLSGRQRHGAIRHARLTCRRSTSRSKDGPQQGRQHPLNPRPSKSRSKHNPQQARSAPHLPRRSRRKPSNRGWWTGWHTRYTPMARSRRTFLRALSASGPLPSCARISRVVRRLVCRQRSPFGRERLFSCISLLSLRGITISSYLPRANHKNNLGICGNILSEPPLMLSGYPR